MQPLNCVMSIYCTTFQNGCNNIMPRNIAFHTKTAFVVGQCVNAISWRLVCTGAIWTVALKLKILNFPYLWTNALQSMLLLVGYTYSRVSSSAGNTSRALSGDLLKLVCRMKFDRFSHFQIGYISRCS